jgi:hypothetical protein
VIIGGVQDRSKANSI